MTGLADVCVAACADLFRDAGEILASPMSPVPLIGARLAKRTSSPDLLISDGAALLLAEAPPLGATAPIEGWLPFRKVFDVVASGRRHVVMGANQLDRYGNQNLSAFGPAAKPARQMFGMRGAPGNSINHATSYWVARHSRRVFCDQVDIVCGVGWDKLDPENPAFKYLNTFRVVTNLGVFDFQGPNRSMRAVTLHPGVTAEKVRSATTFDIAGLDIAGVTRTPTADETRIIDLLDPRGVRFKEVPA